MARGSLRRFQSRSNLRQKHLPLAEPIPEQSVAQLKQMTLPLPSNHHQPSTPPKVFKNPLSSVPPPKLLELASCVTSWPQKSVKTDRPRNKEKQTQSIPLYPAPARLSFTPEVTCGMAWPKQLRPGSPITSSVTSRFALQFCMSDFDPSRIKKLVLCQWSCH